MLKRFEVDNFKTHINTVFEPAPINLLIGKNNAGKTNLCDALLFLSWSSRSEDISNIDPRSIFNWNMQGQDLRIACDCDLVVEGEQRTFSYEVIFTKLTKKTQPMKSYALNVSSEKLSVSGGPFKDTPLIVRTGNDASMLHERKFVQNGLFKAEQNVQTTCPAEQTMLFRLFATPGNEHAIVFKEYLRSWVYYSLYGDTIRNASGSVHDSYLLGDGSNLCGVLYNLKMTNEREYRELINDVKMHIEPTLDSLGFAHLPEERVLMFAEHEGGQKVRHSQLSDGTLRYMAINVIVRGAAIVTGLGMPPPLIIIEEPENGLHVRGLTSLLEMIEPDGSAGQFIFTSHSPLFIDQFENSLDGFFQISRSNSHSRIRRLNDAKVKVLLQDYSLSFLHFQSKLEQM